MTLTTHILTGAVIATEVKNPLGIVALSLAVHFLLDALPHGDYINQKSTLGDIWKSIVDLLFGLFLLLAAVPRDWFANLPPLNITLAISLSLLPDFTTLLYCHLKMKFLRPIKLFHENIHFYKNSSPEREFRLKNSLWELAIILLSIISL